jgi:type IV secretory pathway VirB2 component (pilin)
MKKVFKKTIAVAYLSFFLFSLFFIPLHLGLAETIVCQPPLQPSVDGTSCVSTADEYQLLSPLPGLQDTFDPTQPSNIGDYLNSMITIFIGVCAVLAVIMIIIGGLQYMTSELISSKEEGKKRIRNAIFGLLLALGAWLLLNTINPDILKTDLSSLEQQTVKIQLMEEQESIASAVLSDGGAPSGPTAGCPEGIGKTAGGISVCNSLVSKINDMVNAARAAGCNLTGGGYRSPEIQKQLRIANCNGDYTNRNAECHPPTAIPGASRHQQGLAIDFKSSGSLIETTDNVCFLWLSSNASRYGLRNFPREPWHWSTDGN